jgi:UDP-glucuronate 4-epimerase
MTKKFTKAILAGEPIDLFNYGKHSRDFTYIDDIVEGLCLVLKKPPIVGLAANSPVEQVGLTSPTPYNIFNIGIIIIWPIFK